MLQNINKFRVNNQLTALEEKKFRRIVNYTAKELDNEARNHEESAETEEDEKQ